LPEEALRVGLEVDSSQADEALGRLGENLRNAGESADQAGESMNGAGEHAETMAKHMNNAARSVGKVNLSARSAISSLEALARKMIALATAAAPIALAAAMEQSMNKLRFALEAQGVAWGSVSDRIRQYIQAEQLATGITQGQLAAGLATAAQKNLDLNTSMRLVHAASLLSASGVRDFNSALETLVRAGQSGYIRGAAIMLGLNPRMIRDNMTMAELLEIVEKRYSAAASQSHGFEDSMRRLKASFEAIVTAIGAAILPMVTKLVDKIREWVEKFETIGMKMPEWGRALEGFKKIIEGLAQAFWGWISAMAELVLGIMKLFGLADSSPGHFNPLITLIRTLAKDMVIFFGLLAGQFETAAAVGGKMGPVFKAMGEAFRGAQTAAAGLYEAIGNLNTVQERVTRAPAIKPTPIDPKDIGAATFAMDKYTKAMQALQEAQAAYQQDASKFPELMAAYTVAIANALRPQEANQLRLRESRTAMAELERQQRDLTEKWRTGQITLQDYITALGELTTRLSSYMNINDKARVQLQDLQLISRARVTAEQEWLRQAEEAAGKNKTLLDQRLAQEGAALAQMKAVDASYYDAWKLVHDKLQALNANTVQQFMQSWADATVEASGNIENFVTKVLDGTDRIGKGMRDMVLSILKSWDQMVAKMVSQWAQSKLSDFFTHIGLPTTLSASVAGGPGQMALASKGLVTAGTHLDESARALKEAATALQQGGGGGAPEKTGGFGGGFAGTALNLASMIFGFQSGGIVRPPTGASATLALLHSGERVLSRSEAAGHEPAGGDTIAPTVNLHIHAIDTQSGADFIAKNSQAIGDTVAMAVLRNNHMLRRALGVGAA